MRYLITVINLLFTSILAQASLSDLQRITNAELDKIRSELQSRTEASIVSSENFSDNPSAVSVTSNAVSIVTGDYFGYNFFQKDISFFDNIPTPSDYRLGPGDELIISLWGETNFRLNKVINKDGMIFFDDIGFINISNQTLKSAESILKKELSKIYSTINDPNNPSQLMLSLGKIKSINIYFTGYVENPGINLIHPFSDIFAAIVQAGGISSNGSLREIHLIRNGEIIQKLDFYSFLMNGANSFSDIKLIDGDTIHVPVVKKRVKVFGDVVRPSSYELLPNEDVNDLLIFASGLTSLASSTLVLNQIIPLSERSSDDNARNVLVTDFDKINNLKLNNGDSVFIPGIPSVNTEIRIFGRVKVPGIYNANSKSLKNVLDLAGGFDDPNFRKSILDEEIVVLRLDKNNFYAKEFKVKYDLSESFMLAPGDKVFVYENTNYRNSFIFEISGEVVKPGAYPLKRGTTLKEAINLAGGITEIGSYNSIRATKIFTAIDENGNEIKVNEDINNLTPNFELSENIKIRVLPMESVVRVNGNVYNPGLIAIQGNSITVGKAIELSGGYKPKSLKRQVYIVRSNGEIETLNSITRGVKRVFKGDSVFVPKNVRDAEFSLAAFIADISATVSNLASIILIIDSLSED